MCAAGIIEIHNFTVTALSYLAAAPSIAGLGWCGVRHDGEPVVLRVDRGMYATARLLWRVLIIRRWKRSTGK